MLIFGPNCVLSNFQNLRRLAGFEAWSLAVAVRTARVHGGGVFSPTLSNQLVETMAEILNLTGAQYAPHPHQVAVVLTATTVGMATTP